MSSARIELQPAWLLSQKPYRETSELIEVLTPRHGRIGLVARGLRGPRAKQRGVVSLFRPLLLSWLEKGDLGTMTAAESGGVEVRLEGERLFHGWYLNELLLRLLPRHDPHPALYSAYAETLQLLAGDAMQAEAALRLFGAHGLSAAQRACEAAEIAQAGGDSAGAAWWIAVCGALDGPMAKAAQRAFAARATSQG